MTTYALPQCSISSSLNLGALRGNQAVTDVEILYGANLARVLYGFPVKIIANSQCDYLETFHTMALRLLEPAIFLNIRSHPEQ